MNDIGYYIDKIDCSSNLFTYNIYDISEDLAKIKDEVKKETGLYSEEFEPLWSELISEYENSDSDSNGVNLSTRGKEIIYYDFGYGMIHNTPFENAGKRIDFRLYLWSEGLISAYNQLKTEIEKEVK